MRVDWPVVGPLRARLAREREATLERAWKGRGPHVEEWFAMIDVAPGVGLWLRYTLLDGRAREAAVWGTLFEDRGVSAAKVAVPLTNFAPASGALFGSEAGHLDPRHAEGRVGDLSWHLTFGDPLRVFRLMPPALFALGVVRTDYSAPYADVRVRGLVRHGEREWHLNGARAMLGHIRGEGHAAQRWAWAHCNTFEGAPDAVFEGLSAQTTLWGRTAPTGSSFLLHVDGLTWRFNTPAALLRARSRFDDARWTFSARSGSARLEGEARLPAESQVALARDADTDGTAVWCRNSRLASLRLHVWDPARGLRRALVSDASASFEIGDRARPGRPPDL